MCHFQCSSEWGGWCCSDSSDGDGDGDGDDDGDGDGDDDGDGGSYDDDWEDVCDVCSSIA